MKKKLISVSDNSNIEINDKSMEMLLQGICKSFECEDFRANKCKMKMFLTAIEKKKWECSHTWITPSKFFIHLVKHSEDAPLETKAVFQELKQRWGCLESESSCDCEFFDEIKRLKHTLETVILPDINRR